MVATLPLTSKDTILLPKCIRYVLRYVLASDDKRTFVVLREESPEPGGPGLLSLLFSFFFSSFTEI